MEGRWQAKGGSDGNLDGMPFKRVKDRVALIV